MKTAIWFVTLLAAVTLCADDITTLSGRKYSGATTTRAEPDGLVITFKNGVVKIPFADLPPEVRAKYGYDPAKAAQFQQQVATAQQKEQAAVDAAAQKAAKEKAVLQQPPVRLRGEIRQITKDGLLVEAHFGNERMPNYNAGTNRPELVKGSFFLVGHPAQAQKTDEDWFDVDAVPVGAFDYTTVLGASKRIKAFRVVKAYY